jgi:Holliday junction DNA helicase RuvA
VVAVDLAGSLVLDVHGVGYHVHLAAGEPRRVGDEIELFIHTVVRADAIVLYGFDSHSDREFFLMLLVTPGVGPSTAMAALRTMPTEELRAAIERGDVKRVAQVPGVGTKTASRIVLELKGKLVETMDHDEPVISPRLGDIEEALRSLGYVPGEIRDALVGVTLPDDEAAALRTALQRLGRR